MTESRALKVTALRASGAKRLTDFLDDIGVLRGMGRRLWRRSGLLA